MDKPQGDDHSDDIVGEENIHLNHRESVVIQHEMSTNEKLAYMFYEFMGTFILCYAFNITFVLFQLYQFPWVLYIVSMMSWEVSCAHFNLGITVAYAFNELDNLKENWFKLTCAIIAQLCGAVAAMFVARFATDVTQYSEEQFLRTRTWASVNPPIFVIQPTNPNQVLQFRQQVFSAEFISSVIYFTMWIIIRKTFIVTRVKVVNQYINLIKPFLVTLAYMGSRMIFLSFTIGYLNPTMVFASWINNLLVYNSVKNLTLDISLYKDGQFGRWIWIYFFSSLLAAPFAGYISKYLLSVLNTPDDKMHASQSQQRANLIAKQNNQKNTAGGGGVNGTYDQNQSAGQVPPIDYAFKYEPDGQAPPSVPDSQQAQTNLVVSGGEVTSDT